MFEIIRHGNFALIAKGICQKYAYLENYRIPDYSDKRNLVIAIAWQLKVYIERKEITLEKIYYNVLKYNGKKSLVELIIKIEEIIFTVDTKIDYSQIQKSVKSKRNIIEEIVINISSTRKIKSFKNIDLEDTFFSKVITFCNEKFDRKIDSQFGYTLNKLLINKMRPNSMYKLLSLFPNHINDINIIGFIYFWENHNPDMSSYLIHPGTTNKDELYKLFKDNAYYYTKYFIHDNDYISYMILIKSIQIYCNMFEFPIYNQNDQIIINKEHLDYINKNYNSNLVFSHIQPKLVIKEDSIIVILTIDTFQKIVQERYRIIENDVYLINSEVLIQSKNRILF